MESGFKLLICFKENFMLHPYEEERRNKEYSDRLDAVTYLEYGIPKECPCGGDIVREVDKVTPVDTTPGRTFFTCEKWRADGLHIRQPWLRGVEQKFEKLLYRIQQQDDKIARMNVEIFHNRREIAKLKETIEGMQS